MIKTTSYWGKSRGSDMDPGRVYGSACEGKWFGRGSASDPEWWPSKRREMPMASRSQPRVGSGISSNRWCARVLLVAGPGGVRGWPSKAGRSRGVLDGTRVCSVRHFVEHLMCSAFLVATWLVRGVADGVRWSRWSRLGSWWASGMGSRLGLLAWAGSDFFYLIVLIQN